MKNKLEELRKARDMRQEDLAQALGVSRQTVISLEKGKYNPSLALAFKLARVFGMPIEEIFDDSDEQA
jgi:putative transcriptional regulator